MKKAFSFLLTVLLLTASAAAFTSCGDHEDVDDGYLGKLTVTNRSTYSLYSFSIVFVNTRDEVVAIYDKGTFEPNGTVQVNIPVGSVEYYMGTTLSDTRYFSPNYSVTIKKLTLDNTTVGQWTSN